MSYLVNHVMSVLKRPVVLLAVMVIVAGSISACDNDRDQESQGTQAAQPSLAGTRELPTIYPTATSPPSPTPTSTRTPQPAIAPTEEVAFDQLVVDVTYSIPLLDQERRIRGNVAGEIEVIDENSGVTVTLRNRPGVIVELQQALPKATIEDLPTECDSCVQVDYVLPLTDEAGQGWLRDVQLLASFENYFAVAFGPFFPSGTIAGLRREATPFEVAHSVAVTSEGELWAWTAADEQIAEPAIVDGLPEQAADNQALIDWDALPNSIGHICYEGGGAESLQLEGPDGSKSMEVRCPELYLPSQFVPIYSTLSEAIADRLEGSDVAPPELPMTLDTSALYSRDDGATLTVYGDGRLSAIDAAGASYTLTLTTTQILSATALLLDSSLLEPGPSAIFEEEPVNFILIRGFDNMYELAWKEQDEVPVDLVQPWTDLFELVLQASRPEDVETPAPTTTPSDSNG